MLLISLSISFVVNVGLALQTNFAALLVLRCFQSFGSAGAAVVSSAITADLITRAERGSYMAYTSLGRSVGPALGPLLGGILTKFLGWRSIFWFISVLTGAAILMTILFLRETCRSLVGNGSVPSHSWNRPVIEMIKSRAQAYPDCHTIMPTTRRSIIFDSFKPDLDKGSWLVLIWSAVFFSGCMAVLCTIPALLEEKYNFNPLQVGLCYIPYAVGGFVSRWVFGSISDWNFKRHAQKEGVKLQRNRQTHAQIQVIPLEKARLEPALPLCYVSCPCILGYAWALDKVVHISGPLIFLLCLGVCTTGASNMACTLLLDLNARQAGKVLGAMAMFNCLLAAGTASGALPLAHAIGMGWMGVIIAGVWFLISKLLWVVCLYGLNWRRKRDGTLRQELQ